MDAKLKKLIAELSNATESAGDRQQAAERIAELGPVAFEAAPTLIEVLESHGGEEGHWIRLKLFSALGRIVEGARIPARFSQTIAEALLTYASKHADDADKAGEVVGKLGPDALDTILATLEKKTPHLKSAAFSALFHYPEVHRGTAAGRVVPAIARCLSQKKYQEGAVFALSRWAAHATEAVDGLSQLLSTDNLYVLRSAIEVLCQIGTPAQKTLPAVLDVLSKVGTGDADDDAVVSACLNTIEKFARHDTPEVMNALARAAEVSGYHNSETARKLMLTFADTALQCGQASGAMIDAVLNAVGRNVEGANEVLGRYGARALPRVLQALQSRNPEVRAGALRSIPALGEAGLAHFDALSEALEDENLQVQQAAIAALTRLGSRAVAPLVDSLKEPALVQLVAKSLRELGPKNAHPAGAALRKALSAAKTPEETSVVRDALAIVAPQLVPGAKLSAKVVEQLNAAVEARQAAGQTVWPSPLSYFDTTPAPTELLQFWAYALRNSDAIPCALEMRAELSGVEAAWFTASARAKQVRTFALDERGGQYAVWLVKKKADECPIIFLGDEGEAAVLAQSMAEFLSVLGSGQKDLGSFVAAGFKGSKARTSAKSLKTYTMWLNSELGRSPSKPGPKAEGLPSLEALQR